MSIKGQPIEQLVTIRDTTTGQISVWILIMLVIAIYILYQFTKMYWSTKKLQRLEEIQKMLKKGPSGIRKSYQKNEKDFVSTHKPNTKRVYEERQQQQSEAEQEAMEVYNNLKRKRTW